ncbi:hypothetical protein GGP81_001624 [Salinibacter ruber]|nr:hypothetical protein [Salinibacter ruber]MCS4085393.1 hypothetical protein [Salinibacter ruber]
MRPGPRYRRNGVARTWTRTSSIASRTRGRRFCPPSGSASRIGPERPAQARHARDRASCGTHAPGTPVWGHRNGDDLHRIRRSLLDSAIKPPEGPASRFAGHPIRMRCRELRLPASARARSECQPSSRRSSRCPQARIGASDWAYRYDRGECPKGKTVLPPPVFRRLFFGLAAFPPANATPLLSVLILFRGLFSQTNPQRYEHTRDGTIPVDHIFRLIDFTFHKVGP